MKTYAVNVRTVVREVYYVEAESELEALANWSEGDLETQEAIEHDVLSAVEQEEW